MEISDISQLSNEEIRDIVELASGALGGNGSDKDELLLATESNGHQLKMDSDVFIEGLRVKYESLTAPAKKPQTELHVGQPSSENQPQEQS